MWRKNYCFMVSSFDKAEFFMSETIWLSTLLVVDLKEYILARTAIFT